VTDCEAHSKRYAQETATFGTFRQTPLGAAEIDVAMSNRAHMLKCLDALRQVGPMLPTPV